MAKCKINAVKKNGSKVIFSTDRLDGKCYYFDFSTCVTTGISGKPLKGTDTILSSMDMEIREANRAMYNVLYYCSYTDKADSAVGGILESLLSYPDLVRYSIGPSFVDPIIEHYEGKLPKGYVAWLRENDRCFESASLRAFESEKTLSHLPQSLKNSIELINNGCGINLIGITTDKDLLTKLVHIISNSLKAYEIKNLEFRVSKLANLVKNYPQFRDSLDDTKNIKAALNIYEERVFELENSDITKNQSRFLSLAGQHYMTCNGVDCVIKVPTKGPEFVKEGEMQQNCVGYNYHHSMRSGRDFIYFLRKAESPNKSFITCRYDTRTHSTVEHRYARNEQCYDPVLFKLIDEAITEILLK